MPLDDEQMRQLRELDEATEWELSGEVQPTGTGDSGVAALYSDMEPEDTVSDLLDCVSGMHEKGEIVDLIIIANTPDSSQLLFTNLQRNDLIIGRMEIAKMNWFNTELAFIEEEGNESVD